MSANGRSFSSLGCYRDRAVSFLGALVSGKLSGGTGYFQAERTDISLIGSLGAPPEMPRA
jgi:hypothetical protein